eukprot:CAMPEP_0197025290 /NCGR_PEP_ID=MMETSP1384-20130603/5677_1 /TAXON_ID=29189 /ORGANISM="Ammonia sp." /LENGTH=553 /DNA_ID=CAMNT_0042453807 /DNA_START=115 /DNA_END=1776 /DNA_ORIENTATION=+
MFHARNDNEQSRKKVSSLSEKQKNEALANDGDAIRWSDGSTQHDQNSALIAISGVVFDEMSNSALPASSSALSHSFPPSKKIANLYDNQAAARYKGSTATATPPHHHLQHVHNYRAASSSSSCSMDAVPLIAPHSGLGANKNAQIAAPAMHHIDLMPPPSLCQSARANTYNLMDNSSNKASEHKQWKAIFVPSQMVRIQSSSSSPDYGTAPRSHASKVAPAVPAMCNPFTSFAVHMDCNAVLLEICKILATYSKHMEYKVNSGEYRIDGLIFMDMKEVFFMISIFRCNETASKSHIEFVRKSGDTVSFAKFWCDIKQSYLRALGTAVGAENDSGTVRQTANGLQCLQPIPSSLPPLSDPPDINGLMDMQQSEEKMVHDELEEFYRDIEEESEYSADLMRLFCCSKLGHSVSETHVLQNEQILHVLIERALNSCDIGMVHGALCILSALIEKCEAEHIAQRLLNRENCSKLMYALTHIFREHDSILIKKYAICLLEKLTRFAKQIDWRHNVSLITAYKQFESQWRKQANDIYHAFHDDMIEPQTFDRIQTALFT